MNPTGAPLPAQEGILRTTFEWGRIQSNADWLLPIAACVALMLFVRFMYRRDAVELHPALGWLLTALRSATILVLLVLYLQPQWRTEREVVRNSRALLLVDTSLSMGLMDADLPASGGQESLARPAPAAGNERIAEQDAQPAHAPAATRAGQVAAALEQSDLLGELRKTHDVVILRFDEALARVATLNKSSPAAGGNGLADGPSAAQPSGAGAAARSAEKAGLARLLQPTGRETRLGQALRQLIHEERNLPVSGIVLFSDGGQNAGVSPETAIEAAQEAKIPLFTVGLGSDRQPANVRVYRLEAPPRAHPGDPYSVTGLIQAQHMAGETVTVQLYQRRAASGVAKAEPAPGKLLRAEQVVLGADGEVVPVKFDVKPEQLGRHTLTLLIPGPAKDRDPKDNQQEADIEIVDRRTRVLLLAGGPTREYQFLRNQLHRDKAVAVDVLLQTGKDGMSQEASAILDAFPATREAMYAYDCVVAFDPDWQALTAEQIDLLESWVGEQGGGLIAVAGPVHTGEPIGGWLESPVTTKVRALYPVEFHRRASAVELSAAAASEPRPLDFTREGIEAEFLWLAETATASQQAWAAFGGVYSFFPVRGPKPGATVYAYVTARAGPGEKPPVYLAGQFYGSGRVFYLGSGEMWRLRRADPNYFDQFYTKLIRHVSQGRLLRQSSRGVLMVGKDRYLLGNSVEIRAQLTNAQLEPLSVPTVPLDVLAPGGGVQTITLRREPGRPGVYAGQITVLEEGPYRLELPVPESLDERLTRRIQVALPDLERENPQRNEKLLSRLAEGSGGKYYASLDAAVSVGQPDALCAVLKDRSKTIILPEAPNPLWERQWLMWLLIAACTLLCLEWLIRRLARLA